MYPAAAPITAPWTDICHTPTLEIGKIRRPYSGICYTSNSRVNENDAAFQSRLLTIPFKELRLDADCEDDPNMYNEFLMTRELLSALAPDLQLMGLFDGKLDKHAMQDWANFLQKALGKRRDRNVNDWAKLGYYMALLNQAFGGDVDSVVAMLDWMFVGVGIACYELTNHAGLLDQFVIHVIRVREVITPNLLGPNPDKIIFWHNFRTNTVPPLFNGSSRWWAFRVNKVCHVIKALTGRAFNEKEVLAAFSDSNDAVANSRCSFYDTQKASWPIKKSVVPDEDGALGFVDVPLLEDELLDATMTQQRCVFLKESYVDAIRTSLERGRQFDVDYKTIVVDSANREIGKYNFFNALTRDGWFGYRTLSQSTFRTFCGATNEMATSMPVPDVLIEVQKLGFESIEQCFKAEVLLNHFGYSAPDVDSLASFPACYTRLPYEFRNDEDDEEVADPVDDAITVDEPAPKRRRTRAPASNHARYPRPPDLPLRSLQDCIKWTDYVRARAGDDEVQSINLADDEDKNEVRFHTDFRVNMYVNYTFDT